MNATVSHPQETYRLWIARFENWQPQSWSDVPPRVRPIEAAVEGCFNAAQAEAFIQGFNTQILHDEKEFWAVATNVTAQYQGDLEPAGWISASRLLHCTASEGSAVGEAGES
jgi:hypothetical protein